MNKSLQLADALLSRTIVLNRVAAGLVAKVEDALPELRADIISLIVTGQTSMVPFEINVAFDDLKAELTEDFEKLFWSQAAFVQGALGTVLDRTIFVPVSLGFSLPLVMGASLGDWIDRFNEHARFHTAAAIRVVSATSSPIVGQEFLQKEFAQIGHGIDALIRTAVLKVAEHVLREIAKFSLARGSYQWEQVSILDSRTSKICREYDDKRWDADFQPVGHSMPFNDGPPRHWNCRSTMAIVFGGDTFKLTLEKWLEMKSKTELHNMFGEKQVRLWHRRVLPATDLVRQAGRPLAVADLAAV